ncbi:MAG: small ribosomal subunit Rsm22 family protein [Oscillospiraceae bacterium]
MEFPAEIRSEIERLLAEENTNQLAAAAEDISRRYRSNDGSGKRLASGRRDILAYAAVRMPATFGAVSKALELALECIPQERREFRTALDIGAGTGAATHAAALLAGCGEVRCIEREPEMLALGERLTNVGGIGAKWERGDITCGFDGGAELVLCSYCLNELAKSARNAAVERLWNSTERLLLIVEPGTPEGYANLMEARAQLIAAGAHVVAPCPHEKPCALPEGDWCHFTARIARSRLHKQLKGGDVPYEDEKFCFIAASRKPADGCTARVLRHPEINSGRITLKLCTAEDIRECMVTRKDPRFKAARKSDAGDSFGY